MLSRFVANPAVRFFAIFILIVEAAAFASFSMNASRQSVNESVRQVIPRDLTSE